MTELTTFLHETTFYGNSLFSWLLAVVIGGGVMAALLTLRRLLVNRIGQLMPGLQGGWAKTIAGMVQRTTSVVFIIFAVRMGAGYLILPAWLSNALTMLLVAALFVQVGLWASYVMQETLRAYIKGKTKSDPGLVTSLNALSYVGRLLIWACVLLLVLDNFGIDITALVAGLGIGGIAVALAAQNILGDLFSSLSIVLDKPFVVGDFLILDSYMGSVEHVGLKTTRLRSLSGEQIILSNTDVLNSRVRNYGRMLERRVVASVGVTYQTPHNQLQEIPGLIKAAIEAQSDTRFDRAHFSKFGAYSLDFEYVYYVLSPDYNLFMDRNQEINFTLHRAFEQRGIAFAFPTQTVFVEQPEPSKAPASRVLEAKTKLAQTKA